MSDEPDEREAESAGEEPVGAEPAPKAARPRVKRRKPAAESAPAAEPAAAPAGVTLAQERAARRALTGGATLAVLGILLVGIGPSDAGTALSLGGLIALVYGIHTYGRLGPEPAK